MTQKKWLIGVVAILMASLLGIGCSTGNSGSDDDDMGGGDDISALVGTWKSTYEHQGILSTDFEETTFTVSEDGSFSRLSVTTTVYEDTGEEEYYSYACKGKLKLSGDRVTLSTTSEYEGDETLEALPTSGWVPVSYSESMPIYEHDGKMYNAVYTRQGSGTGLVGTWTTLVTYKEPYEGMTLVNESTNTLTFTDDTITEYSRDFVYPAGYRDEGEIEDEESDTYPYSSLTAEQLTIDGTVTWRYIIDGNVLLILREGETAYEKQP